MCSRTRLATIEEEAWLDAQDFWDDAHARWLSKASDDLEAENFSTEYLEAEAELAEADEAESVFKEIHVVEKFRSYQMMKDVQEASAFLVHTDLATKASFQQLNLMRQSLHKLVDIINEALHTVLERERNAALQQVENVMKLKRESEAIATAERLQLQSEVAHLKEHEESLRELLEQERDKSVCRICFVKPRDVIALPCMHFDYCHGCLELHQRSTKTCPSCRSPLSGTLKCNLTM